MRRLAGWFPANLGQSPKTKLSFSGKRLMSALARNTAELAKIFKVIEMAPQAVRVVGF